MHEQFPSKSSTTVVSSNAELSEQLRFWRYCSIVLGVGLILALMTHSGPKAAGASEGEGQSLRWERLSIGGFDEVDGHPAFVMENARGNRIGVLPMVVESNQDKRD